MTTLEGTRVKITHYRLLDERPCWWPSELEQREAARFCNLTWDEYLDLSGTMEVAQMREEMNSKCEVVAHWRVTRRYEAVLADIRDRKFKQEHPT